jgi:hypothetical protein
MGPGSISKGPGVYSTTLGLRGAPEHAKIVFKGPRPRVVPPRIPRRGLG